MAEHASQAVLGHGTQLRYGNLDGPPETFTLLHDVVSVTPPNSQNDKVEVSHLESPNKTIERIQGWNDNGDMTFELNWRPDVYADHAQIVDDKVSGQKRNWECLLPSGMHTMAFPATVTGLAINPDAKGAIKATVTLTCDDITHTIPEIT